LTAATLILLIDALARVALDILVATLGRLFGWVSNPDLALLDGLVAEELWIPLVGLVVDRLREARLRVVLILILDIVTATTLILNGYLLVQINKLILDGSGRAKLHLHIG